MTGKNPGSHGVFSFVFRETGTYERKIIDPKTLKSRTLSRILSDAGKRAGIINVPMCDAEKINGFVIPGFLSRSEGVPYPAGVKAKIQRKFGVDRLAGDLEIDALEKARREPELFFERVDQITDEMAEICLYLLQRAQAARQPEVTAKNEFKRYVNDNPRWSGGHDGTHDPTDVPGIIGVLGSGIPSGKEL